MRRNYDDPPAVPEGRQVIENPLKPHGLAFLVFAAGAGVLAVLGLIYGGDNLFAVLVCLVAAGVTGVRGLVLFLQPFAWPRGIPFAPWARSPRPRYWMSRPRRRTASDSRRSAWPSTSACHRRRPNCTSWPRRY